MKSLLFGSAWACIITATIALYIIPVPFQASLLLFLGVVNGRMLARWV